MEGPRTVRGDRSSTAHPTPGCRRPRSGRSADRRRARQSLLRRRKCGPNPTDRGRSGSKLNVMTDSQGVPLAVQVSAANEHDISFLLPLSLVHFPRLGGVAGHPPAKPKRVRADAGYTSRALLNLLEGCGIEAEIPQRGQASETGLGRQRWPVERTISWLKQYRRVGTRRERRASMYEVFVTLACAMITYKQLKKQF
ncbi:DDE transposase [Planctomycetales bacterium 10988]|nr:DDE transposase [Planctomycetales bacterium 10988]